MKNNKKINSLFFVVMALCAGVSHLPTNASRLETIKIYWTNYLAPMVNPYCLKAKQLYTKYVPQVIHNNPQTFFWGTIATTGLLWLAHAKIIKLLTKTNTYKKDDKRPKSNENNERAFESQVNICNNSKTRLEEAKELCYKQDKNNKEKLKQLLGEGKNFKIDIQVWKKNIINSVVQDAEQARVTHLFQACIENNLITVKLILSENPNVNEKSKYAIGFDHELLTPLLYAVKTNNDYDIIKELLNHGANVNDTDSNENTPLILLCKKTVSDETKEQLKNSIQLLLEQKNIKIDDKNKFGQTALMYLCANNSDIEIVKMLIEKGADLYVEDREQKIAFDYAREDSAIQKYLKENGADKVDFDKKCKEYTEANKIEWKKNLEGLSDDETITKLLTSVETSVYNEFKKQQKNYSSLKEFKKWVDDTFYKLTSTTYSSF